MVQTDLRAVKRKPSVEVHAIQEEDPARPLLEKVSVQIVPEHPERVTQIAADLPSELREQLVSCLTKNQNIFAWTASEITSVAPTIMDHRLNILPGTRPVRQKWRYFSTEQDKIIREEINKLRLAGQIREVQFPTWLANVVLVPKPGGKWRVCVDFRDLNKACPKDCYPLPRIDQLVDSTSVYELICMMDAYQGYHQIPLALEDQEKVSFVTSDGTFCYTVMPFGLKNAGATYQRLMDRVFQHQFGCNVEVYVDDILIKSKKVEQLTEDMEEIFGTLRQYDLKLNPNKCPFGVKGGCFLSYIVTERGIEANPAKVRALQDMASPRNVREVQKLVGKITLLSRFISHSAERSLPFFKVLRWATRFSWDEKCEQAFTELKYHILKDAQLRYSSLEKLALALTLMAQFSEYDIQYQLRTAIKAQALADFLTEVTGQDSDGVWKIYVDDSSTKEGSGVGVKLNSPLGDTLQLTVKLQIRAINNEAEYEAILAGLQVTRHLGATRVIIHSDSQLVDQQIKGTFEIRNERLKRYAEAVGKLKAEFQEVVVQKVPRADNQRADYLAKLASSLSTWEVEGPTVRELLISQIDQVAHADEPTDWRTPLIKFLKQDVLPENPEQAKVVRRRAAWFVLIVEALYKRAFSRPLLKCLGSDEADYVLREIHQGCCGNHTGGRTLVRKTLLAGGGALTNITEKNILKFLWQNIVCRFGIPCRLVSDNGRQFQGWKFQEWCKGLSIQQAFTSVYYP
ncbi:uncharacterized protein LOC141846475 [Curcuma longa]|uniref:uncharacterized protein LOC141846475 n=1 Tax=Curcuma longa TaxID=136217 RepID=UPI003D9EBD95